MEKNGNTEDLLLWLGEAIFPQPVSVTVEKFGENTLVKCIENGWVQKCRSKIGTSVHTMNTPAGYLELSASGWKKFQILENESIR